MENAQTKNVNKKGWYAHFHEHIYLHAYTAFATTIVIVAFFVFAMQIASASTKITNDPRILGVAYSASPTPPSTTTPSPSTTVTSSASATPSPSSSSSVSPSPSASITPSPVSSPIPNPSTSPSPSPSPVVSATPIQRISPTPTPSVNPVAVVSKSPNPQTTPKVTPTPELSPSPIISTPANPDNTVTQEALRFRRGDVDGDEFVSVNDILILSNYLYSGNSIICKDAADTNDDGRIDISDLVNLSSYISYGGDRLLPSPGSRVAGIDPTKDNLGCEKYPLEKKLVSPTVQIKQKPLNVNVLSFIDTDKDGVNDFDEKNVFKTDPLNTDTDGDGFSDGQEASTGHDPKDPAPSASIAFYAYGKPRMEIKSERACYNDFVKRFNVLKGKKTVKKSFLDFAKKASCYGGYNDSNILASLKDSSLVHASIPASAWTKRAVGNDENIQNAQGGGAGTSQLLKVVSPQEKKFRRGDANIDGKVDISDMVRITEIFTSTKKMQCEDAADANDDGAIDLSDAIYISSWYSLGTVQELPSPGAFTAGYDPTPDSLGCETYPYSGDIGTLNIEPLDSAGTAQKKTDNVLLGKFKFTVKNEPVSISMFDVHFRLNHPAPDVADLIRHIVVRDESGQVIMGPKNSSYRLSDKTRIVIFTEYVVLPVGEHTFSIYGDLDFWIVGNSLSTFLVPNELVVYGIDSVEKIIAMPEGEVTAPEVKIIDPTQGAGTLNINLDSSVLPARLVVAGSSMVPMTAARLQATNEDIDITQFIVRVADGGLKGTGVGNYTQISKFYLKLDGNVVGNSSGYNIGASNMTITLGRGDLTIPMGTVGKKLEVLADLVKIGTNEAGTDNADIKVGLNGKNGFIAVGNGSNAIVTNANKNYNDSTGTAVILHKAVPQIVLVTPTNTLGTTSILHEAKITAVGGNIGVFRLSYTTAVSSGVGLTNAYTRLVSCGGGCGGIMDGSQLATTVAVGSDVVSGVKIWNMAIDSTQSHGKSLLSIANGATATIDFIATATLTTNADTVSTSLLGDTASTMTDNLTGAPAYAFTLNNQGDFVWSDFRNTEVTTSGGLTSPQWFNGYLVSGLGSTATSTPITIAEGGTPGTGNTSAGLDASALSKRLVVSGSSAVPLTDIRLKATNESIDITKLTVTVADAQINSAVGDYTQISKVYLKLDGNIVGSPFGYNMGTANLTINLVRGDVTIPEGNIGKKLSVLADIVSIGSNLPGTESADIVMGLGGRGPDGFTAMGNLSAALIPVSLNDTTGSAVILHKSVPQIVMVTPINKLSAMSVLHEAKITAVGGNIGIYRLSYVTTTSVNVNLANGYTRLVSCGGGCGGIMDGSQLATTVAVGSDVVSGVKIWNMAIDSTQSHGKSLLSIANGATATIDFIATATLTTNADTVSTSLLGDTASTTPGESAFAYKILNQGNFVWSDLNITETTTGTGLTTKQWFNGYLVAGLGVTSTSTPLTIGE